MNPVLRLLCVLLAASAAVLPAPAAHAADAWTELARPAAVVLFRHAHAPGIGDPENFKPGDCSTQRNLDEEGRAQARRLGQMFRTRNVAVGAVLSSQWCRTRETASLAFGAQVREEAAFNSFFRQPQADSAAQTARAQALIAGWRGPGALVVVTHQVNITALTGVGASSGEGVVVRRQSDGSLAVVATIRP